RFGQIGDDLARIIGLAEEATVYHRREVTSVPTPEEVVGDDADDGRNHAVDDRGRLQAVEDGREQHCENQPDDQDAQNDRAARDEHVARASANDQADRDHLMSNYRVSERERDEGHREQEAIIKPPPQCRESLVESNQIAERPQEYVEKSRAAP